MELSKTRLTTLGKFIALVLRHKPEAAGLTLDLEGWAPVNHLLANTSQPMKMHELEEVVKLDSKGRYAFNEDKTSIRAVQGHSVRVDAGEKEITPPKYLYHGTSSVNLDAILREGLKPMSRQFVHLSERLETAKEVGKRHIPQGSKARLVILRVDAWKAFIAGYKFYIAENGVYLTYKVPYIYLKEFNTNDNTAQ